MSQQLVTRKGFFMRHLKAFVGAIALSAVCTSFSIAAPAEIRNDTVWTDTTGNEIKAQGGNILKVGTTYYWYGAEIGTAYGPAEPNNFRNVKCYSSTNLASWTFCGNVFTPSTTTNVDADDYVLRPTVIYNSLTSKYVMIVMWKPINEYNPSRNHVAYLTSDNPTGPFTWIREDATAFGYNLGDIDVFKDTDDSAYLVYTSDENYQNGTVGIARLSSTYTSLDTSIVKFYDGGREAANILKKGSTYYLFTSGTQNWDSTQTKYRTATSLGGPWSSLTVLPTDPTSSNSFNTQADFVIPVTGSQTTSYIYAGDRYSNLTGVGTGRTAWFPLNFDGNGVPTLKGYGSWFIDTATGTISVPTNYVQNSGFEAGGATQTPANWAEWSDNASTDASYTGTSNPYEGSVKLIHKKASAYRVSTSQVMTGLSVGTYTLRAYVQSSGGQTSARMVAKNCSAGVGSVFTAIPTTSLWTAISLTGIAVDGSGQCQIDFWSDAGANQWISVDKVEFTKQ